MCYCSEFVTEMLVSYLHLMLTVCGSAKIYIVNELKCTHKIIFKNAVHYIFDTSDKLDERECHRGGNFDPILMTGSIWVMLNL